MTRSGRVRRAVALLAILAAGAGGALTATPSATAEAPASHRASAREAATTKLTFRVDTCARCHLQLFQAINGKRHVWVSRNKRVRKGEVSWTFASKHTRGLSVAVHAPWEGSTGYVPAVVFRYAHEKVGTRVAQADARDKRRGSGCWAGTTADAVTMRLNVRKVTVQGYTGRTNGTLAWTRTMRASWKPMYRTAPYGILGSQDAVYCDRP
jgi:hypothetical protein